MSDLPETPDETQEESQDESQTAVAEAAPLLVPASPDSQVERILESLLLASEVPLSLDQIHRLVGSELGLNKKDLRDALERLAASLAGRASELREVASGWRIQVRANYGEWVAKLYQEKPPRLSRALLETLALVCYRQPITRGEIEEVRGVALSPNIVRTLLDRGWIREVGVKEVPGRPSLFGTTPQLLDDLNLKSLDELPSLPEIKDPQQLEAALARLGEQLHEVPPTGDEPEALADDSTADVDSASVDDASVETPAESEPAVDSQPPDAPSDEAQADASEPDEPRSH
jgi:segregation and condensation protein B